MMSEMLRSFDEPILDDSGTYHARVILSEADWTTMAAV